MVSGRMHADEFPIDAALVRRLLAAQFPHWATLPITPVPSAGTDNAIYRLGDALAVRLPRIHWATGQAGKEWHWLAKLAPQLPLAIPVPLALGEPGEGYPWQWTVAPWLPGENANTGQIDDLTQAAADLAQFLTALWRVDPTGGPPAGKENFYRGVPLAVRDRGVREALANLEDLVDVSAATAAWEAALRTPPWHGPPVWLHGDLQPGNLLAADGRLSAVIDFGCLGVGDPAADVMAAWMFFSGHSRAAFRAALAVDDATWARGRGWALTWVGALAHYRTANPVLAAIGRHAVEQVLADGEEGA